MHVASAADKCVGLNQANPDSQSFLQSQKTVPQAPPSTSGSGFGGTAGSPTAQVAASKDREAQSAPSDGDLVSQAKGSPPQAGPRPIAAGAKPHRPAAPPRPVQPAPPRLAATLRPAAWRKPLPRSELTRAAPGEVLALAAGLSLAGVALEAEWPCRQHADHSDKRFQPERTAASDRRRSTTSVVALPHMPEDRAPLFGEPGRMPPPQSARATLASAGAAERARLRESTAAARAVLAGEPAAVRRAQAGGARTVTSADVSSLPAGWLGGSANAFVGGTEGGASARGGPNGTPSIRPGTGAASHPSGATARADLATRQHETEESKRDCGGGRPVERTGEGRESLRVKGQAPASAGLRSLLRGVSESHPILRLLQPKGAGLSPALRRERRGVRQHQPVAAISTIAPKLVATSQPSGATVQASRPSTASRRLAESALMSAGLASLERIAPPPPDCASPAAGPTSPVRRPWMPKTRKAHAFVAEPTPAEDSDSSEGLPAQAAGLTELRAVAAARKLGMPRNAAKLSAQAGDSRAILKRHIWRTLRRAQSPG